MLSEILNKTEVSVRYFTKMRKSFKTRAEASARFHRLQSINITVIEEILDELKNEQSKIFNELEAKMKVKFYKD